MKDETASHEIDTAGRRADSPSKIPKRGWFSTLKRVKNEIARDHIPIVAAGVAFYFFLAIFPALTAFISIYGLAVSPGEAASQVETMADALPADARKMIAETATNLATQSNEKLGWGVALSLLISLWSAKKGTNALFDGLNIAYNETESRGFIKKNALTLMVTVAIVVGGVFAISLVALVPAVLHMLPLPDFARGAVDLLRWPLVAFMIIAFLAWLYRVAPDREPAEWRWLSAGSVVATILWLVGSGLFSWYIDTFGAMDKTYGTFAAVVILMLWLLLTAFAILIGAELNGELEHQTAQDTTTGEDEPLGERGAYHADHVAPQR